ncbi:hypothetical protein Tco_0414306 [Tanacetum coccineum]
MSTYLKHMGGYKHSQLKNKSFDEIQKLFDKEMTRVNMFVDMDTKMKEGSNKAKTHTAQKSSSKRASDELEQEKAKKQKGDDDQEEEEMKKHMEIVQDDKVAINAIPLATKPPMIVKYKIDKEGNMGYFKLIRADGSSKRPEEDYERVLWGDLKVMFEPDVESEVWRNLQEKKYPLTPATITEMLNKKLQTDYWNEICYQLLKLMTKLLQLLSDYYCWKDYADRDEIKDLSEKR